MSNTNQYNPEVYSVLAETVEETIEYLNMPLAEDYGPINGLSNGPQL